MDREQHDANNYKLNKTGLKRILTLKVITTMLFRTLFLTAALAATLLAAVDAGAAGTAGFEWAAAFKGESQAAR